MASSFSVMVCEGIFKWLSVSKYVREQVSTEKHIFNPKGLKFLDYYIRNIYASDQSCQQKAQVFRLAHKYNADCHYSVTYLLII